MKRFPTRTIVLMGLAVLSFGWFWWQTHRPRSAASTVHVTLPDLRPSAPAVDAGVSPGR